MSAHDDPGPPRQPEATFALVSVICGVIGLLGVPAGVPLIPLAVGAFGVTTGLRGRHGNVRQRMAVTGAVLGGIAVLLGIAMIAFGTVVPVPAPA